MLQITALFSIIPHFGKKTRASQTKKSMCTAYELAAVLTHSLGGGGWGGGCESKGQSCQPGGSNGDRSRKATELTVLGKIFILLVFSLVSDGTVAWRCLSDLSSKSCRRTVQVWGLELKELQSKRAHEVLWAHLTGEISAFASFGTEVFLITGWLCHMIYFSAGCCLSCRNGKSNLGPTANCCWPFELRGAFPKHS